MTEEEYYDDQKYFDRKTREIIKLLHRREKMNTEIPNLLELDELGERAKNEPLPDLTDWDEITSNLILMLQGKFDYYYECYADDNSYSVTVGINSEGGLTLTYSPNTFEQELDFTYEYLHELVNDMKRYRKGRARWILIKN